MATNCAVCGNPFPPDDLSEGVCPQCRNLEVGDGWSIELDLDEEAQLQLADSLTAVLQDSASYLAAKSRAVWFKILVDRARRDAGPVADELVARASHAYQLIERHEKEMEDAFLQEAGAAIDSGLSLASERRLISLEMVADLDARPLTWDVEALFLRLITLLPDGDVTLTVDPALLVKLREHSALQTLALANAMRMLEQHHLVVNLTPQHPLDSGVAVIAVNPMVTEHADKTSWERARQRWLECLDSLLG